ncbi:unnamed protein product, partial [Closterium sp. NIES-53]
FRLVEGFDVAAAEAEVRAYEANNRDSIAAARAKRAERRAAELRAAALPPKPGESSVYQLVGVLKKEYGGVLGSMGEYGGVGGGMRSMQLRAAALSPKSGELSVYQLVGVLKERRWGSMGEYEGV